MSDSRYHAVLSCIFMVFNLFNQLFLLILLSNFWVFFQHGIRYEEG